MPTTLNFTSAFQEGHIMNSAEDFRPAKRVSPEDWEVFAQAYSGCLIDQAECKTFRYQGREWVCISVYYSQDMFELTAYEVETVLPTASLSNPRNRIEDFDHRYTGMVLQVVGENRRVQLIGKQTGFIRDFNVVGQNGRQLELFREVGDD
jgi:hypothetical protein